MEYNKLNNKWLGEPNAVSRARMDAAHQRQRERFGDKPGLCYRARSMPS